MAFILLLMVLSADPSRRERQRKASLIYSPFNGFSCGALLWLVSLAKFVTMVEILESSKIVSKPRRPKRFCLIWIRSLKVVFVFTALHSSQVQQTSPSKYKAAPLKTRSSTYCPKWLRWPWTSFTSDEAVSKHFKLCSLKFFTIPTASPGPKGCSSFTISLFNFQMIV